MNSDKAQMWKAHADEWKQSAMEQYKEAERLRDVARWMAQVVHEAYHQGILGGWRKCPHNPCATVRDEVSRRPVDAPAQVEE